MTPIAIDQRIKQPTRRLVQRAVARELEAALEPPRAVLRGRRYIEPLHHHVYVRGSSPYFPHR